MEWSGLNGQNTIEWEQCGPKRTEYEPMDRLGPKWTYGLHGIMVDWIGPMLTEVYKMDGIGTINSL